MSSDSQLAALLGEPPRKRRAAAVAAQKNWQMLSVPEDEAGGEEEDLIEITQIIKNTSNVPKLAPILSTTTPSGKRTSLSNNIIIDLNHKRRTVEVDRDYSPPIDLDRPTSHLKARKSFPTPPPIQSRISVQNVNRYKGKDTVLIETDTSKRVIVRTDGSNYRKPTPFKLTPTEPFDNPIVEGEEEVIVGTYEDDLLVDENICDDVVEELSLLLFCESENKSSKDLNESKDDIEVIEVVENKSQNKAPLKTMQSTSIRKSIRPQRGQLEPIIDTLEMDCENFDDEFTDGLCFDCEEDILNETQWKLLVDKKKDYLHYSKSVTSTKKIKFVPEADVKEAVGIVSTIVSETTRIVATPTPVRMTRTRPPQPITIQSVRTPIPSIVNQMTPLRAQLNRTTVRPHLSTPSQLPFTIIPVSTSGGVTNPVIISPPNFVNSTTASNLGLILQGGGANQPTYVMLPRSSIANGLSSNILITSGGSLTTANRNIHLANALQASNRPRIITPTANRFAPPTPTRFMSPGNFRVPQVRPVVTVSGTNQTIRVQNYSNINQSNVNRTVNSNPLFDCLTVFKGTQNASKKINMRNVLTIKPLPFSWPSNIDSLINSLIKLDNALMKEKFKESPIAWMVNANLILPPKCKVCEIGICNQVNKTLNSKSECWHCNNPTCKRSFLIDRPHIFAGPKFDIPVSKLLFLIYYWSIQVDVEDLIKTGQIEMGTEKIFNVWSRLQKVCSMALQSKDAKLGPMVEVCSIQVGRFHVLGAMERNSHRAKLDVIPIHEIVQKNGKQTVMLPFVRWLSKGCHVMTCEPKFEALRQYGYKVTVQSKNEFLAQNKNLSLTTISGYLIHHLQRFFKDMDLTTLTSDILINILNELLWRERYGNNPFTAFYNIIKHISEQCGLTKPHIGATIVQVNIPTGIRTPPVVLNVTKNKTPQTYSRPIVPELNETNSIFVDEYYYSSLTLKTSVAKTISQEESTKDSIQCHLCQMFFDNILIVKHLLEHFEKERGGRIRKGDNNEPECKHCLRFFSNRALHMHEELANSKLVPFSCRICLIPMLARQPFIGHMKTTHFSGEMPYYCDICSFRSSFQKILFDHFEAMHSNSSQVMCPYCIRVFDVTKFKNISSFLYRHLTTHYAVASVYDCDKCVLTFTTKPDLKEHCFKGHNPSNPIDEKFDITPHKVQDQDKTMCTRAKEQELFTPFLPNFENNPDFGQTSTPNVIETDINTDAVSYEISCEPNITDFLSMEPDIQINLTEGPTSIADYILPVDCDYTNDQLKAILTKSFETNISNNTSTEPIEGVEPNPNTEPIPEPNPELSPELQKYYILSNNQKVVCFECKTEITTDHFTSRMVCEKCNFTSHCKTSFDEHITGAHLDYHLGQQTKSLSVLRGVSKLASYKSVCKTCGFCATDGNQIALHMIQSNHLNILCKPLDFETNCN